MKKKTFKWIALCVVSLMLFAASAVPAFAAALSGEELDTLLTDTRSYVEMVMGMDDAELAQIETYGDFYQITAQAVRDSREDIGAFKGLREGGEITQDGSTVTMLIDVDAEKYGAQVEITYNADENLPKNFVINPEFPLSVNMANAGRNTVIGLVVVFVVLVFLAFVISLLKYTDSSNRKKKKKTPAPEPDESPVRDIPEILPFAPEDEIIHPASDEEELIAVMAAAIAAASADGAADGAADGSSYVVRSIRKIGSSKRWKRA